MKIIFAMAVLSVVMLIGYVIGNLLKARREKKAVSMVIPKLVDWKMDKCFREFKKSSLTKDISGNG